MNAYLLVWNSLRWNWKELNSEILEVINSGTCSDRWSSGNRKYLPTGSRFFLIKLGAEPRGIIGSGYTSSKVHSAKHWEKKSAIKGEKANYVGIEFDTLLNPIEKIFPLTELKKGPLKSFHWESQSSGILIPTDIAEDLEKRWTEFLGYKATATVIVEAEVEIEEGEPYKRTTIEYTRQVIAKTRCLQHYGLNCLICGFNFEKYYGEIGAGYIQVHHLKPLHTLGRARKTNPITDMIPVCPNCHAMLHRKKPALTQTELKNLIKNK